MYVQYIPTFKLEFQYYKIISIASHDPETVTLSGWLPHLSPFSFHLISHFPILSPPLPNVVRDYSTHNYTLNYQHTSTTSHTTLPHPTSYNIPCIINTYVRTYFHSVRYLIQVQFDLDIVPSEIGVRPQNLGWIGRE